MQEGEQGDFYYLHTNGNLIYKRICPEREPGGFVVKIWELDKTNRTTAWRILTEARAIGADQSRIDDLARKWRCDDVDGQIYCERQGWGWSLDGSSYCITSPDFVNLAEDVAGFGDTMLEALSEYLVAADIVQPGLIA